MKTLMLAAILSFGVGSAFAADAPQNGYVFPDFWGTDATQQVPATDAPAVTNGAAVGVFATQPGRHVTYLFPPNPYG